MSSAKPHILIAEARFYDDIGDLLLAGTTAVLDEFGVTYESVQVAGALELPAAILMAHAGKAKQFDAYIALGCVIRGETYHFEVVSNESARGLMDLSIQHGLAIANGILTCETREQAITRADPAQKDKGGSFARAALDMWAFKKEMGL